MALSPESNVEFDEDGYPVVFSKGSELSNMESLPSRWKAKPVPQPLSPKPWIVFQRVKVPNAQKGSNKSQLTQALSKQAGTTSSKHPIVPVTEKTRRRVTFAVANSDTKPPTPPQSKTSVFEAKKSVYFHTKDEILYSGKNRYEDDFLLVQTLLKQERLRSERLKMAAEEEEVRRRRRSAMTSSSTSTSSRSGLSDRSNQSNTTTSSSSTNITTPDLICSSPIPLTSSYTTTSVSNPSWTCHNCGTTNPIFDTTCWHCKIHSRCVDCAWDLSSTADGIDEEMSQLEYPSVSTRFNVATLLNMPLTAPSDLTRQSRERVSVQNRRREYEYMGDTTREHGLPKGRTNQYLGPRSPATVEVSRVQVMSYLSAQVRTWYVPWS